MDVNKCYFMVIVIQRGVNDENICFIYFPLQFMINLRAVLLERDAQRVCAAWSKQWICLRLKKKKKEKKTRMTSATL